MGIECKMALESGKKGKKRLMLFDDIMERVPSLVKTSCKFIAMT